MNNNGHEPQDIPTAWLSLVRRMQWKKPKGGYHLMQITVLCDKNGDPMLWLEPKWSRIEPTDGFDQILELFGRRDEPILP